MLSRVRRFWRRHRRAILLLWLIATSSCCYVIYVKLRPYWNDIRETLKLLNQMKNANSPPSPRSRWELGFDKGIDIARTTLHGCSVELRNKLKKRFDVEKTWQKLPRGKDKDMALWEDFRVKAYARTISAMYCASIASILVHIQVFILQRYHSDSSLSVKPTNNVFKKFLSLSQFFMLKGVPSISGQIQNALAISEEFAFPWSDVLTFDKFESWIGEIRHLLDNNFFVGESGRHFVETNVFPENVENEVEVKGELDESDSRYYGEMISETRRVVTSADFLTVVSKSLDVSYSFYMDYMKKKLFSKTDETEFPKTLPPTSKAFRRMIPETTSPPVMNKKDVNSLMKSVNELPELEELCRLIYMPIE